MSDIIEGMAEVLATQKGYEAFWDDPSDGNTARERGLYQDNEDLCIMWDSGWGQAWLEWSLELPPCYPHGRTNGEIVDAVMSLRRERDELRRAAAGGQS